MKKIVFVFLLGIIVSTQAQIRERTSGNLLFSQDSTTFKEEVKIKLSGKTTYTDYKIISFSKDTSIVDTTLTYKKDLRFNYLRKDLFELLPFHNQGQTFNKLGYSFNNASLFPEIGVTAKQYNYYKINDVYYYEVPTPTSEIMYKTGLEQGQMLDAFLTLNTAPQFNFSIAYKGLRSLGKYRHSLASHGNFRTSFNYHNKRKSYYLRGHFSSFDLLNEENGGLPLESIFYFESDDPNYIDRARLDVNFTDAESMFEGKRYVIDQVFSLFPKNPKTVKKAQKKPKKKPVIAQKGNKFAGKGKKLKAAFSEKTTQQKTAQQKDTTTVVVATKTKDSVLQKTPVLKSKFDIKIGHTFTYETQHYRFKQTNVNSIFGEAFDSQISDHTSYQKMNNQVYLQLDIPVVGTLRGKINYFNYNYKYKSILYLDTQTIPDKLKGNVFAFGVDWKTTVGKLQLTADANSIIAGDITGSNFKASVQYKKDSVFYFKGYTEFTSKTPNFNKLLYQSDYKAYNWYRNFSNEKIMTVGVKAEATNWGAVEASYNNIENYTYFNSKPVPVQAVGTLNYIKVKASKAFHFGKFTSENTVMYQKVTNGSSFFRVPDWVTQNTVYYSNYIFKGKPMYLQTGVTLKYFSAYKANAFNPLLNEFVLQDATEIGNYPILDLFINAQIRRTRLYFKIENFSSSFTGRNYYAAPNYPYRDLTVRFGLVWNWFI